MRLPAKRDIRHAGDVFDASAAADEIMAAAMRQDKNDAIIAAALRVANQKQGITPELPAHLFPSAPLQSPPGSWDPNTYQLNERNWPARYELPTGTYTKDMVERIERRESARAREDFVGQGAYGNVYSDEPGLVRKEITGVSRADVQEEVDNQLFLAEAGVGPRVASYDTMVHGDPNVQAVVMQDLRDNYSPIQGEFAEHIDDWTNPGRSIAQRRFALAHQKQMGALALKGMNLLDRHTGNIMKHKMTGRPMQLDAGIAGTTHGDVKQVEALVDATVQGFRATGQYDVAEIINDTAYDYLVGGQEKEAWDFTREAFAQLQKIKEPTNFAPF